MSVRSSIPSSSGGGEMYSLKWNHYHSYLTSGLAQLLNDEFSMTDVTLACEGQFIQAHKVALAVCSPFFKEYFKTYRMEKSGGLIVLANVRFKDLKNLIKFIYQGEVNISNADLNSFLRTANDLKIEGLMDAAGARSDTTSLSNTTKEQLGDASKPSTSATESTATPRLPAFSHSSASSGGGAPPIKRSRLSAPTGQSTSIPTTSVQTSASSSSNVKISQPSTPVVNQIQSTAPSIPLPNYDPLDMEEEQEEEMISLDEVKPEPISVYTVNDEEEDSLDHHGGDDSNVYHNYDSPLGHPSGPGPSSGGLQSHRMQQPGSAPRTVNKPPAINPMSHWRTPRVLDGKFFKILSIDHEAKGIGVKATCMTCQRTIQGRFKPTSNFTTHIKHGHKDMFESYILYKQSASRIKAEFLHNDDQRKRK